MWSCDLISNFANIPMPRCMYAISLLGLHVHTRNKGSLWGIVICQILRTPKIGRLALVCCVGTSSIYRGITQSKSLSKLSIVVYRTFFWNIPILLISPMHWYMYMYITPPPPFPRLGLYRDAVPLQVNSINSSILLTYM